MKMGMMGFATMMSHTLPTSVAMVVVFSRIPITVVAVA